MGVVVEDAVCEVRRCEGKRLRRTEGRVGALELEGLRRSGMLG